MTSAPTKTQVLKPLLRAFLLLAVGTFLLLWGFATAPLEEFDAASLASTIAASAVAVVLLALAWLAAMKRAWRSTYAGLNTLVAGLIMVEVVVLVFAYTYASIEAAYPLEFDGIQTRLDSLYFTVTVFSTVGFGDITPDGQLARALVTIQQITSVVVLGAIVRLTVESGTRASKRRRKERLASQSTDPELDEG